MKFVEKCSFCYKQILTAVLSGAVILSGCAASPSTGSRSSGLYLPDSVISDNIGNIEGLYAAWIDPLVTKQNRYIPHLSTRQRSVSEAAIGDGFGRFCTASDGTLTHKLLPQGDRYVCSKPNAKLIGELSTQRYLSNQLQVNVESPERIERRVARQKNFETRKAHNGPTGVLVTDKGQFKFIRLGNLRERHVLDLGLGNRSKETIPVEEIEKIVFHKQCCDIDVTLRDGRIKTLNQNQLAQRTNPDSVSTYRGGKEGLPVVVVDVESGQPYTRIFSNFNGIQEILFDDVSRWKDKSAKVITTEFKISSPFKINRYLLVLREQLNQLYIDANNDGWFDLFPHDKLPLRLMEHLQSELRGISRKCGGDAILGLVNTESPLRCRIASRELDLILKNGYSLDNNETPMSSIIVLNKVKSDLPSLGFPR